MVIVTFDPAIKYEDPSERWVKEPDIPLGNTAELVNVATTESSILNSFDTKFKPVPAVYVVPDPPPPPPPDPVEPVGVKTTLTTSSILTSKPNFRLVSEATK